MAGAAFNPSSTDTIFDNVKSTVRIRRRRRRTQMLLWLVKQLRIEGVWTLGLERERERRPRGCATQNQWKFNWEILLYVYPNTLWELRLRDTQRNTDTRSHSLLKQSVGRQQKMWKKKNQMFMEYCGTSRYAPNHKTPSLTCYSRAELDGEHNSNGSKFLFLAIEGDDDDYYYCYRGPLKSSAHARWK